jgi:hypothetical protein
MERLCFIKLAAVGALLAGMPMEGRHFGWAKFPVGSVPPRKSWWTPAKTGDVAGLTATWDSRPAYRETNWSRSR